MKTFVFYVVGGPIMNSDGLDVSSTISLEGSDNNKLFAIEVNGVTIDIAVLNFR